MSAAIHIVKEKAPLPIWNFSAHLIVVSNFLIRADLSE